MSAHRAEDGVHQLLGAAFAIPLNDLLQPMPAKHLALRTGSVKYAIADEQEHITAPAAQIQFVVSGIRKQADGQAGCLNLFYFAVVAINRAWQAGVGKLQR